MNKTKPPVAILFTIVFSVLLVGGWWAVPSLQSAQDAVSSEASEHLERARRLLDRYDAGLTYKSLLVTQLGNEQIDADPDEISDTAADEYEEVHQALWTSYQPTDWGSENPRTVNASYGNVAGQIRDGLRTRDTLARENQQLLTDALRAIDQALAINKGDASSRTYSQASRLKAVIQYHTGISDWARARMKRREADLFRRDLVAVAADASASSGAKTLVNDCNIDGEIQRLQDEIAKVQSVDRSEAGELAKLDRKIADLSTYHQQAVARAQDARQKMDQLKDDGIDFADEAAVASFRTQLEALSLTYREASREAHALETGSLQDAQLDRPGDFLDGQYVTQGGGAPKAGLGLAHYRNERAVLAAKIEGRRGVVTDLQAAVQRFEDMKKQLLATEADAQRRIREASKDGTEIFAAFAEVEAEAIELEEDALQSLDQASRSARDAAGNESSWVSEAQQKVTMLSSEAAARSPYQARTADGWMKGHMAVQEADSRLAKAWIHYDRLLAATQNIETLELVTATIQIADADLNVEKEAIEAAREAGVDEVTQARKVLDRNHRDVGDHWTLAAQAAGTTYLMTLFGHDDYLNDTITAYRNAVQGRETQPFAAVFVKRLAQLESR